MNRGDYTSGIARYGSQTLLSWSEYQIALLPLPHSFHKTRPTIKHLVQYFSFSYLVDLRVMEITIVAIVWEREAKDRLRRVSALPKEHERQTGEN
jgi:hypothetical protein